MSEAQVRKSRRPRPMPEKSTPPAAEAFRETFLFILDPEEAETFRRFGDALHDLLLDRAAYDRSNPPISYTVAQMTGALSDLRFLERFLGDVGAGRHLSELTDTEQSLSLVAEGLAPEVAALAGRLEEEIERLVADDEGDEEPADGER